MAEQAVTIENEYILEHLSVLNKHMDKILGRVIDPILVKFMRSYTQQNIKPYPPVPPNSTYERTKELFRHWDVTSNRRFLMAQIENTMSYAPDVVGDEQEWYHARTGWEKLSSHESPLLAKSVPIVNRGLESEMTRFLFTRGLIT